MAESTPTRTPARIILAFLLIVASGGVAFTDIFLTHDLEPTVVGKWLLLPNRIFEVVVWVLVGGLALFRNRLARIALLVMTMATASIFLAERPYPLDTSNAALAMTLEFALRIAACALLFTRHADAWYARTPEEAPKRRSVTRTLYALGTSSLMVLVMAFAMALDNAGTWPSALFGLIVWAVAVGMAVAYMLVPRVAWPAKLTGLLIAVGAPVIARLLYPLLEPLAGFFV